MTCSPHARARERKRSRRQPKVGRSLGHATPTGPRGWLVAVTTLTADILPTQLPQKPPPPKTLLKGFRISTRRRNFPRFGCPKFGNNASDKSSRNWNVSKFWTFSGEFKPTLRSVFVPSFPTRIYSSCISVSGNGAITHLCIQAGYLYKRENQAGTSPAATHERYLSVYEKTKEGANIPGVL